MITKTITQGTKRQGPVLMTDCQAFEDLLGILKGNLASWSIESIDVPRGFIALVHVGVTPEALGIVEHYRYERVSGTATPLFGLMGLLATMVSGYPRSGQQRKTDS